jgi:hypothetical protein
MLWFGNLKLGRGGSEDRKRWRVCDFCFICPVGVIYACENVLLLIPIVFRRVKPSAKGSLSSRQHSFMENSSVAGLESPDRSVTAATCMVVSYCREVHGDTLTPRFASRRITSGFLGIPMRIGSTRSWPEILKQAWIPSFKTPRMRLRSQKRHFVSSPPRSKLIPSW